MSIAITNVHSRLGPAFVSPPTDYLYGERQYSVEDFAGTCLDLSPNRSRTSIRRIGAVPWANSDFPNERNVYSRELRPALRWVTISIGTASSF